MTKYPPPHHQEADFANCVRLVEAAPLATVITAKNSSVHTTHTPLVYHKDAHLGYFIGHIDKYNPQVEHLLEGGPVTVLFHGPETYISPSVYQSTQLPTWNYFKAHFDGSVEAYTDHQRLTDSLVVMTTKLEGPNGKYQLAADNPRMASLLDYIIGFKITIQDWEGKFKLSQDKHPKDQQLAKQAMEGNFPGQKALIGSLYAYHQTKR